MKKIYLLRSAIVAGTLLLGNAAQAQLTDCNVFMQGHYVELGVMPNGAYGSTVDAPSGYHNNVQQSFFNYCGGTLSPGTLVNTLGFVADPDMDGWDVGTPAYVGDYYMPGYPQEGWSMEVGGAQVTAYAYNWTMGNGFGDGMTPAAGSNVINGTNTAYTNTGGALTGTWEGIWVRLTSGYTVDTTTTTVDTTYTYYTWTYDSTGSGFDSVIVDTITVDTAMTVYHFDTTYTDPHYDSIGIKQVTTLDSEALYFLTSVTLTNLSTSPSSDIYYMRTLDPDNDEPESSDFTTTNTITSSSGYPVVTAVGTVYSSAFIALGSTDPTAVPFICTGGLVPTDAPDALFGGTGGAAIYSGTNTIDVGIGMVYHIGSLPGATTIGDSTGGKMTANNSKTFGYFYAFKPNGVDAAVAAGTLGVKNVPATADVHVYPNPAGGQMNVTGLSSTDHIILIDMMGKRMELNGNINGGGTSSFSLSNVPPGAYVLDVFDAQGNLKSKVPVQKL